MNRRHHHTLKPRHLDGLAMAALLYGPGPTKENITMNTIPETTPAQRAEQAGHAIASGLLDALLVTRNQADAFIAVKAALRDAFNDDGDPIVSAVAGGFAGGIINVLERGIQAIKPA